ncbi:MAG: carboxypeptidase regulatory-like domain-containing protein [Clostridia bacterium]|nr:carboxypeptidase regulatory-like domain-containing protein [Clostridia bacterium]
MYSASAASAVKSGAKVEISGTSYSATTDANGFYQISGVPAKAAGYKLVFSKPNYLTREINVSGTTSLMVGTQAKSVKIWAGDMETAFDYAINMSDIVTLIDYFNSAAGDSKYKAPVDFNKDGAINMEDILIVIMHFNTTAANYPTDDYGLVAIDDPKPTYTPVPTEKPTNTPSPTPNSNNPPWSANDVYTGGSKVSHNGSDWEALWWTKGEEPGKAGVWKKIS